MQDVNDALALGMTNIGIAAETEKVFIVNSNPKDIVSLILFGKATYRKMIQNLIWERDIM